MGREQIEMYNCERMLLETADFKHVKELVIRLNTLHMGCSVVPKLFSEWELPVPIQHATEKIPVAALKDFVHVLVAKSKQHLNLGVSLLCPLTLAGAQLQSLTVIVFNLKELPTSSEGNSDGQSRTRGVLAYSNAMDFWTIPFEKVEPDVGVGNSSD